MIGACDILKAFEHEEIKRICRGVALDVVQALGYTVNPEEEEVLTYAVIVYFAVIENNRKLKHLCDHSKKRRTRKKNRARLLRLMGETMKAATR